MAAEDGNYQRNQPKLFAYAKPREEAQPELLGNSEESPEQPKRKVRKLEQEGRTFKKEWEHQ